MVKSVPGYLGNGSVSDPPESLRPVLTSEQHKVLGYIITTLDDVVSPRPARSRLKAVTLQDGGALKRRPRAGHGNQEYPATGQQG
ncbi:hypothetical protein chiPu_0019277 [Chiloscyllium punctatum]|uniref:Uncharacterized protein n=1 Tax=Chiloscyllium punctatum TaxID=137246 RepID=A0A401RRF0_CHIPU|nr:hypothetical protein [Chiloscyllium punctatum]